MNSSGMRIVKISRSSFAPLAIPSYNSSDDPIDVAALIPPKYQKDIRQRLLAYGFHVKPAPAPASARSPIQPPPTKDFHNLTFSSDLSDLSVPDAAGTFVKPAPTPASAPSPVVGSPPTSTEDLHNHTFTLDMSDLSTPDAAGTFINPSPAPASAHTLDSEPPSTMVDAFHNYTFRSDTSDWYAPDGAGTPKRGVANRLRPVFSTVRRPRPVGRKWDDFSSFECSSRPNMSAGGVPLSADSAVSDHEHSSSATAPLDICAADPFVFARTSEPAPSTPTRQSTLPSDEGQHWFEDPAQFRARSENHIRYDWTWSDWDSPSREIIYEEYQSPPPIPKDMDPDVLHQINRLLAVVKEKAERMNPLPPAGDTTSDASLYSDTSCGTRSFSPVDIKAFLSSRIAAETNVSPDASAQSPVKPPPKFDLERIFAKKTNLPEDSEDISSGFSAVDVHAILAKKMTSTQESSADTDPGTPCPVRQKIQSHFTARRSVPAGTQSVAFQNFYQCPIAPALEPASKSGFGWKTIASVAAAAAAVGAGLAYAFLT
ncbi:hypothetical protein MN608_02379 [Microdochium nivale]|nr:hypothetical protein MN608_02379 [Microdochium nivale]